MPKSLTMTMDRIRFSCKIITVSGSGFHKIDLCTAQISMYITAYCLSGLDPDRRTTKHT